MTEPAIIFNNVSKSYPLYHHITGGLKNFIFNLPNSLSSIRKTRYEVFKNISFRVERGETVGVIGKNGAGKSTVLGLIAGVLKPSGGNIVVNGRVSPLLELGAGFHMELTGEENIIMNGILMGLTRSEINKRLDEIIEFSELGEFIEQPIRTYSSGMLSRLGFSVVANLDPEILLVDEVLAVGDIEFQRKCIDKMMAFKKNGVTIVFVSHNMKEIERICNRAIWIEHREIRKEGEAEKVIGVYLNAQG